MRGRAIGAGLGLLAFLISIAITMWMWGMYNAEVAQKGTAAQKQAQQFAGRDENGRSAMSSLQLVAEDKQGTLQYLVVDSIVPEGAMAKTFGLQPKDAIIAAGPFNFREYGYDEEMAKALMLGEFQKGEYGRLTVLRNGKSLILPAPKDVASGPGAPGIESGQTAANDKPAEEEKVVPKELRPLKGVLK
jgi:hypothetical protein